MRRKLSEQLVRLSKVRGVKSLALLYCFTVRTKEFLFFEIERFKLGQQRIQLGQLLTKCYSIRFLRFLAWPIIQSSPFVLRQFSHLELCI